MSPRHGPSWPGLVVASLPMLGCMAMLAWRRLGQVRAMTIAAARLVVQMLVLGVVLGMVFAARNPWVVLAAAAVMLAASAYTVASRQRRTEWVLRLQSFFSMGIGAAVTMAVGTRLALRVEPWYEPGVIVPMLGMILGNSVNAVSLGAERLEGELRAGRDLIETRLALGATSRQAAEPALRAAVGAALTPVINGMMIAGIVSIPGMMTGQILAGADVADAMRYQILIYLLI